MIKISKTLLLKNTLAEARREIPEGMAAQATYAAIAQAGVEAAIEGYFGAEAVDKAVSAARAEQRVMDISDELISDIAAITRSHQATHTNSDFPLALSQLRTRRIRDAYEARESQWRDFATVITTPDFKPIRSGRARGIPELRLRPEGTDVKYAPIIDITEDGYRVANYERAVKYTWEMHLNDDVQLFTGQLRRLGQGARHTETVVVFEAIKAGLPRTALPAGVGAPSIQRFIEMEQALAARTFDAGEGVTHEYGYGLTDVIFGTAQRVLVEGLLKREFMDFQGGEANPMMGLTPHLERMWSRVMGSDYIGFDNNAEWLEVAFLQGFEGGPRTYTKLPDVRDFPDEGSFSDHALHVKVGHNLGAKVVDPTAAIRVQGAV